MPAGLCNKCRRSLSCLRRKDANKRKEQIWDCLGYTPKEQLFKPSL